MKKHLLLLPLLLLFPACAAMQQQAVDVLCNEDGAYQQGYNDGHGPGKMDSSFVAMCPADQEKIRRSYREGFEKGAALKASEPQPVEIHVVHEGSGPGWECKEAFGTKACGYDCRESYGQVKCARVRSHNCVAAFGAIRCGLHCREEYGEIVCDRYE
jgi:hypothetical protein